MAIRSAIPRVISPKWCSTKYQVLTVAALTSQGERDMFCIRIIDVSESGKHWQVVVNCLIQFRMACLSETDMLQTMEV